MNLKAMFYSFALNVVGFVVANCVRNHFPSDLQFSKMSLLHHLVRKALPVFQRHLHEILPWGKALHIHAFQTLALRAHEAALQVVELDSGRFHVGGVLQVESVLGGVGVVHVGAEEGIGFGDTFGVFVMDEIIEEIEGFLLKDASNYCEAISSLADMAIVMQVSAYRRRRPQAIPLP